MVLVDLKRPGSSTVNPDCFVFCGLQDQDKFNPSKRKWKNSDSTLCRESCHNNPKSTNYVNPSNTKRLEELGYLKVPKGMEVINYAQYTPQQKFSMEDTNNCYGKQQRQCDAERDCYYCTSDITPETSIMSYDRRHW